MNIPQATKVLASLAQENRMKAFQSIIEAGNEGITAGAISKKTSIAQNTMSFHLANLESCGLVKSKKSGQFVVYTANFLTMESLFKYLLDKCFYSNDN
jgi:ArsR family transcriptional regulator